MVAAPVYELLRFLRQPEETGSPGAVGMDAHGMTLLAIGFAVSFVVLWGVVAWFINWVRHRGFAPFAIYRFALGAAVLVGLLQH
jgi:undecaprenyl-diphosphatase